MVTKCNLAGMKLMHKESLFLSKCGLTQERDVRSMAMWDSVLVNNFVVTVIHLQIGLGIFFLNFLISLTLM